MLVIGLLAAPSVSAQSGKNVGTSLCDVLTSGQVRAAFDVRMRARPDAYACYWSTVDIGDPERGLVLSWHHVPTFDALKALRPDAVELLIGNQPALWDAAQNTLSLGLESGVLAMTGTDLQGTDWQGALTTLGELVTAKAADLLAPPPPDPSLLALVPTQLGGEELLLSNLWVDKEYPAGDGWSGEELRKALKKAGRKASNVSIVSAQLFDASASLSALQVKGGEATAFAPAASTRSLGKGWTSTPETFTDGTVHVVVDTTGQVTNYVFPKDDVVWVVRAEEPSLSELLGLLPGAPTVVPPGAGTTTEEMPAEGPVEDPLDGPALDGAVADVIPTSVGGEELMVQTMQGSSGSGFNDSKSRTYKALTAGLKSQGKTTDDITIAAAQNANGEVGILGIEVDGADASAFVDFAIETVLSGLPSRKHKKEPGEVAGKAVTVLRPQQAMGRVLHIYPQGDIVWIVSGPDTVLEEIFSALP